MHNAVVRIQDAWGRVSDLYLLISVASEISGKVLCALGDFSTSPVVATIRKFRDEYTDHIRSGKSFNSTWSPE
jgi:NADH-quinone oxidoreductase subunit F